jgi:outer membrane lipoprotein SlyB
MIMEQSGQNSPSRARLHPLVAGAAVAVILASAAAIASLTGILPSTRATSQPSAERVSAAPNGASAPLAAASAPSLAPQPNLVAQAAPGTKAAPRTVQAPPVHHRRPAPAPREPAYAQAGGSSSYDGQYAQPARPVQPSYDPNAGQVVSIAPVQASSPTTGLGALGGAVVGGLLGNQIGNGRGRTVATVAGAVGGGLAGNGIEGVMHRNTTYQVRVQMQDGTYRSFMYQSTPSVQVGQRVRVAGDTLVAE